MLYRKFFLLLYLSLCFLSVSAQEYFSEGKNRLNFAKTYFELGGQYSPSFNSKTLNGNVVSFVQNSASLMPYLNIGGIHFWGHADFYISIPLGQINLQKNNSSDFLLNQSVITGARFLPLAYKDNRIRPYVGASWAVVNFKQKSTPDNAQPLFQQNKLLLDLGLLYGKGNWLVRAGINYNYSNKWQYPLSQTNFQEIETPDWSGNVSIIYTVETTRSKKMEKENERLNQYGNVTKPTKDALKFGDYFIGAGFATSFMLSNSKYNNNEYPYFNKKGISRTYLDASIGYHFNRAGIITALSYRSPKFVNEAFGIKQTIQKNSFALEAYKFLTDYNGFTPYLGLNITYDNIRFSENQNIQKTFNQLNPGITFGWDILPGKTEQFFVLRTNLRWYPFSSIKINGQCFSQHQLEYNVIQAVFYPARYKNAKKK
ncbi:hypothetical protein [Parapedobacter sp. 2B3]|uniref:hypothetical protein n=1 Tax=Parapedobacter sp. 2B3 TaxID=3342381 RepID=UPI0035B60C7F